MFQKNCFLLVALFAITGNISLMAAAVGESKEKPASETDLPFVKDKPAQKAFMGTDDRILRILPVTSNGYGTPEFATSTAIGKCADKDSKVYHVTSDEMIAGFQVLFSKQDSSVAIKFESPAKNNEKPVASYLTVTPVFSYQWAYFTTPEYGKTRGYRADFKLARTKEGNFKIFVEDQGKKSYLILDDTSSWLSGSQKPYFATEEYLAGKNRKPTTFWFNGIEIPETHFQQDKEEPAAK